MKEKRPSFTRGLFSTLLLYLLSVPMGLVPLVGPVLAITLIPYLSAALGTRYTHPSERLPLAFTAAVIWSALQTLVMLLVLRRIAFMSPMGFRLGSLSIQLMVLVWTFNILFTVLGARHPWNDPFKELERSD